MPANVSSNPFTDPAILFEDVVAANDWRLSLTVPDAGATPGVVSQGAAVTFTYSAPAAAANFSILQPDASLLNVPIGDVITAIGQIHTTLAALIASLEDAGIIDS